MTKYSWFPDKPERLEARQYSDEYDLAAAQQAWRTMFGVRSEEVNLIRDGQHEEIMAEWKQQVEQEALPQEDRVADKQEFKWDYEERGR